MLESLRHSKSGVSGQALEGIERQPEEKTPQATRPCAGAEGRKQGRSLRREGMLPPSPRPACPRPSLPGRSPAEFLGRHNNLKISNLQPVVSLKLTTFTLSSPSHCPLCPGHHDPQKSSEFLRWTRGYLWLPQAPKKPGGPSARPQSHTHIDYLQLAR